MSMLLYIHGFLSSPQSYKAQRVGEWLRDHRPDIDYLCPFLPPYPLEAAGILETIARDPARQPLYLMGSSLGGYWATWLAEQYDLRAVLINPAVRPRMLDPDYVGVPLKNYHVDETYELSREHVEQLTGFNTPRITRPENYWLMVQTGDETLGYRDAVEKYAGCKQTVEQGGDHGFRGFERWIPSAVEFLLEEETTEDTEITEERNRQTHCSPANSKKIPDRHGKRKCRQE